MAYFLGDLWGFMVIYLSNMGIFRYFQQPAWRIFLETPTNPLSDPESELETLEVQSQLFKKSLLMGSCWGLPSGKRLHNYGKSQFLMGKSTINGHFQ